MGDAGPTDVSHHGTIRYVVADKSLGPDERSLFGLAGNESITEHELEIHDFSKSDEVVKGVKGLDVQGFTFVEHESALSKGDTWYDDQNLEDIYYPEVCDLACKVLGASRATVVNGAFRRKAATLQKDPKWTPLKDSDIDKQLAALPRDTPISIGKTVDSSLEPLRVAHLDYTLKGLTNNIRYVRKDVADMFKPVVDALDAKQAGQDVRVPRYAAFSIWRPVKQIKRDGLAVLDWRSLEENGLDSFEYRVPSNVTESGEFYLEAYNVNPPKDSSKHRWYCMPEQKPNQVLFLKLADSWAGENPDIAGGCGHCAPLVAGTEDEEPRESVEARVLVFWD